MFYEMKFLIHELFFGVGDVLQETVHNHQPD